MQVSEIFETLDYGPAPESRAEAEAWLSGHGGRFGHFINGAFTAPARGFDSRNPATGKRLARLSAADRKNG